MSLASAPSTGVNLDVIERSGSEAFAAARQHAPPQSQGRPTPASAFYAAQRRYLDGERIDMQALAAELGISRPTLYRWTGGREQLLSDVLFWSYDAQFLRAKERTAHLSGAERLMAHFRQHVGALVTATPLQMFLQQETQAALRILTSRDSSVQIRGVARLAQLYREEQRAGTFTPRVDVDTLAYAVVKVTEAFIYNDAILAVEPEVERAATIVALLLSEPR
jgi:AcrR family transcriptional regulator